jgi:aspartate aminotransferase
MEQHSALANAIKGSDIVKLGNAISARIKAGEKIYNYTIGDFDPEIFPIPRDFEEEIISAYTERHTNYPPADGVAELRAAVASFIKEYEGISYNIDEIQIASGGRPLIYSLFRTLVDPGDKVIYAIPSWNNNYYTQLNNGDHCPVDTTRENNFMPTAKDIAPHIPCAALLCLCTPQNPTGTVLEKEELEKICDLVLEENKKRKPGEKKLYLMFDQMYFVLVYGNTKHYNPVSLRPEMKAYTIYIDGISKAFAATGVRVGWAAGPAHVIAKMKALLTHMGAWAPMPEQIATARFLTKKEVLDKHFSSFKAALERRLWAIYDGIIAMRDRGLPIDAVAPQAAIYLTIKIDLKGLETDEGMLETQDQVTEYILAKAGLAIVPFYAFGADRESPWYRMSVGTCKEEEIEPMLQKLEQAIAAVRKVKASNRQPEELPM